MKKVILLLMVLALIAPAWAQQKNSKKSTPTLSNQANVQNVQKENKDKERLPKVYDETISPWEQIEKALSEANATGRKVICQVGGNWCPWCLRFADFITKDEEIAHVIKENYVYIHVNVPKKDRDLELMKRLGNPGRFGYPVFVILDEKGNVLHIQNSSYLEEGTSYDRKKVLEFFIAWTKKSIENIR